MRNPHPDPTYFIGKSVPDRPEFTILRHVDSGLIGSVFLAHSDALGRDAACKLIPREYLIGDDQVPAAWKSEITNANQVASEVSKKRATNGTKCLL